MGDSNVSKEPLRISLPSDVWSAIVFAVRGGDDQHLRSLVERAVNEAKLDVLSVPHPEKDIEIEVYRGF